MGGGAPKANRQPSVDYASPYKPSLRSNKSVYWNELDYLRG